MIDSGITTKLGWYRYLTRCGFALPCEENARMPFILDVLKGAKKLFKLKDVKKLVKIPLVKEFTVGRLLEMTIEEGAR